MRYRFFSLHPFREADAGGAGSGNQGGQGSAELDARIAQAVQGLLARNSGNSEAALGLLLREAHGYRERIRELEGQVPAQGSVVLTTEQGTTWQSYQQLGAPDALTAALKERETAQSELKTIRRDLELRDVAAAAGYSLDVLRTLAGELSFVVKDEQKDGKAVKVVAVKDGDKETPIDEYAKAKWAAFLPALRPEAQQQRVAYGTPRQQQQRAQGGTQQEQPRRSARF
jgi:hypothetical protein